MSGAAFDCDVLVVGLGPVGSVLTALLAQRGVRVIALEKEIDSSASARKLPSGASCRRVGPGDW